VLPDFHNADVGGVHDADEEPGNSGGLVGEVAGHVGTVPGWVGARSSNFCSPAVLT
jgi:hypothetical protein